jgi:hypothetical protein
MKKEKQFQLWIEQLSDTNDAIFKSALDSLSESGDISVMGPIAGVMFKTKDRRRRHLIAEFFANIEEPEAKTELIRIIQGLDQPEYQIQLLSVIWNSRMDFSEFLLDIVELAIDGSFEIAMECHTIIENMVGPFDERDILESQLLLSSYEKHPSRSREKDFLIADIANFIKRFDSEIEA